MLVGTLTEWVYLKYIERVVMTHEQYSSAGIRHATTHSEATRSKGCIFMFLALTVTQNASACPRAEPCRRVQRLVPI